MKAAQLPNYQDVQREISSHDPVSTPAEMHGLICGLICASNDNDELPPQYQESTIMRVLYPRIHEQFTHALDDETFQLKLLLPDDDQSLLVRTEAIGEWAQGFIAGLGEGGFSIANSNPDVQELLEDFQAIAQIQVSDPEADIKPDEEDERAYAEVYEYIRMAALNIYTDLVIAKNIDDKSNRVQ